MTVAFVLSKDLFGFNMEIIVSSQTIERVIWKKSCPVNYTRRLGLRKLKWWNEKSICWVSLRKEDVTEYFLFRTDEEFRVIFEFFNPNVDQAFCYLTEPFRRTKRKECVEQAICYLSEPFRRTRRKECVLFKMTVKFPRWTIWKAVMSFFSIYWFVSYRVNFKSNIFQIS